MYIDVYESSKTSATGSSQTKFMSTYELKKYRFIVFPEKFSRIHIFAQDWLVICEWKKTELNYMYVLLFYNPKSKRND